MQQPQADPLEAKADAYSKKFGIAKEDAAVMLQIAQAENAPLIQRNQHLEAMVQGSSRVQAVFQAAMDKDKELFADPRIQTAVFNNLTQLAAQGQLDYLEPAYALEYGAGEWARLNRPWASGNQPPPPANIRPFTGSFGGPQPGYTPPAPLPNPNVLSPEAQKMAAQMAAYTRVPLAANQ